MRAAAACSALLATASLVAGNASAQYQLRADAYFAGAESSTGLMVLTGEARQPSWLTAETVVWLGTTADHPGDVMVASVRARHPDGVLRGARGADARDGGRDPARPPGRARR